MPIAEPDRTKGTIAEGFDGGKGTNRGCGGEKGWSMWEEERDRVGGDGRTALCVSVSHARGRDVESGNCVGGERLLRCRYGSWTVSMALLDMLVGHDLRMLRIALLCDLRKKSRKSQSEGREEEGTLEGHAHGSKKDLIWREQGNKGMTKEGGDDGGEWKRIVDGKGRACGGREDKGRVERGNVREGMRREGMGWMEVQRILANSVARSVGRWLVRGRGCRLVLLSQWIRIGNG